MCVLAYVYMYVCVYVCSICICIDSCSYVCKIYWQIEIWILTDRMQLSVRLATSPIAHLCNTTVIITYAMNDSSIENVRKVASGTPLCGTQAVPWSAIFSHVKEGWLRSSGIWRCVTGWHYVLPKRRIQITCPRRAECTTIPPWRASQNQQRYIHFPRNVQV
jgi:hypothetical protein